VLLMRAIGDLQLREGGEPITEIEVGITAGYLNDNDGYCAVGLSPREQRWYERDLLRRG